MRRTDFLFLGLLWVQLFLGASGAWMMGTYYSYGPLVPLAGGWLFWARLQDVPPPPPVGAPPPRATRLAFWCLFAVFLVLLGPLRVIERGDPDWRLPLWIHTLPVVVLTLLLLAQRLGRKGLWHFCPLVLFLLTAIAPPHYFEYTVIHRFSDGVLHCAANILPLTGIPVRISGMALCSGDEVLDVDDGCSGIRSLQSLVMVALFFGEFFRLGLGGRLLLLLLSPVLAFLLNALRVILLSRVRFLSGQEAYDRLHDGVGSATFIASALLMLGTGLLLARLRDQSITTTAIRTVP